MPKPNVCVRDTKVRKNLGFATCFFRKMEGGRRTLLAIKLCKAGTVITPTRG
jgi:hypothetical protein